MGSKSKSKNNSFIPKYKRIPNKVPMKLIMVFFMTQKFLINNHSIPNICLNSFSPNTIVKNSRLVLSFTNQHSSVLVDRQ